MTEYAEWVVRGHRALDRYVLGTERVVLATRHHWGRLIEPIATAVLAFFIVAALTAATSDVFWWLWYVALGRAGWRFLAWRLEWFVATDQRMLLLTGIFTHKVAMMPLHKVTDMSYTRSVFGWILGYGEFVLESAGQDQAMRRITWVPRPDATYRSLCTTIFGPGGGALPPHLRALSAASPEDPLATDALPPVFPPSSSAVRPEDGPVTAVRYSGASGPAGASADPEPVLPYRPDRVGWRHRRRDSGRTPPAPGDDPAAGDVRGEPPAHPH